VSDPGLMQADAYAGFNRLYEAARKPGPITQASCWAHARRKLFDLARINKAPIAVERIDALFAIECEINGKAPPERKRVRIDELLPWNWKREQQQKAAASPGPVTIDVALSTAISASFRGRVHMRVLPISSPGALKSCRGSTTNRQPQS
jgi:Transposase IS66 family